MESWRQIVLLIISSIALGILLAFFFVNLSVRFVRKRVSTSDVEEQREFITADLIVEVNKNYKIATEHGINELLPFQTQRWDTNLYKVNELPVDLRQGLEQAYADMQLANLIVWWSIEFGRRTPDLNEKYMKLCNSIIERLDRLKPLIERLVNKPQDMA